MAFRVQDLMITALPAAAKQPTPPGKPKPPGTPPCPAPTITGPAGYEAQGVPQQLDLLRQELRAALQASPGR
jgi:hypothetical protein